MIRVNKKIYEDFLTNLGVLPLDKWSSFKIEHGNPTIKEKIRKELREKFKNINGLYIYKINNRILYIGKAKPLYNRLYSHFRESFEKVPGDTKENKWHRFFSSKENINGLEVYWIAIEGEYDRIIIEKILVQYFSKEKVEFEFFIK